MWAGELLHLIIYQGWDTQVCLFFVLGGPEQASAAYIELLSSVCISFSWVREWMYRRYWVACTITHDFHRWHSVFGEVLARPNVEWWELWSSRLDPRSRKGPCSFPFVFRILSSVRVCRVLMVRSLSMGIPSYLKESTFLSGMVLFIMRAIEGEEIRGDMWHDRPGVIVLAPVWSEGCVKGHDFSFVDINLDSAFLTPWLACV